jgi:hypothetical protein
MVSREYLKRGAAVVGGIVGGVIGGNFLSGI